MFNLRLTARPIKAIKLNPNAAVLEVVIPVFGREPSLASSLVSSLVSVFPSSTTNLPSLVFSTLNSGFSNTAGSVPFTPPLNSGTLLIAGLFVLDTIANY